MPTPWDSIDRIEANLSTIANLRRGQKLRQADPSTGLFGISNTDTGRRAADSITELRRPLRRFFRRAIVVATCDESPRMGMASVLLEAVVSNGLPNLRSTYARDSMFNRKTDQRNAVDELIGFIRGEVANADDWMGATATAAFTFVRNKYKQGYKSSNKGYEITRDGKYTAPGVPSVTSKRNNLTFEQREQQRRKANAAIVKQRNTHRAESTAKTLSAAQIATEIARLERDLDAAVLNKFGAGVTFRNLNQTQFDELYAFAKAHSPQQAAALAEAVKKLAIYDEAAEILRTKATPADPWKARAGNCGELAELARLRLEQDHLPFICEVSLSGGAAGLSPERSDIGPRDQRVDGHRGDHAFTIFGLRLPRYRNGFTDDDPRVILTPKDRQFLRRAWVIDPWVNVCCRIDEYPSRFWAKMKDWSAAGKTIAVGGEWINPDPWINSWYARTISELDWAIREYRDYNGELFDREERQQARQQARQQLAPMLRRV